MIDYFVDTNIFMYAAGKEHYHKKGSVKVLKKIVNNKIIAGINTEIIQEILYRYSLIGSSLKGYILSKKILSLNLQVLPVTEEDIKLSLELFRENYETGIKPRDTLHISTMINNNIENIISTDKHFDVFSEIKRYSPEDI